METPENEPNEFDNQSAQTTEETGGMKHLRAEIEKRNQALEALTKETQALRRESTFEKTKLELNAKQREAVEKLIGDEEFNTENVLKTAVELGFAKEPEQLTPEQSQSLDRIADASSGAQGVGTQQEEFQSELDKAMKSGNQKEVLELLAKDGWADRTTARWDRVSNQQ